MSFAMQGQQNTGDFLKKVSVGHLSQTKPGHLQPA
jgi:hypothetical protein